MFKLVSYFEMSRLIWDSSSSSFYTFFFALIVNYFVIILFRSFACSIIVSCCILCWSIFLNISWFANTWVAKKSHPSPSCLNISSLRIGLKYDINSRFSLVVTSILSLQGTFDRSSFIVAISTYEGASVYYYSTARSFVSVSNYGGVEFVETNGFLGSSFRLLISF